MWKTKKVGLSPSRKGPIENEMVAFGESFGFHFVQHDKTHIVILSAAKDLFIGPCPNQKVQPYYPLCFL